MTKENIFITGASGCIGHYVVERFFNDNRYHLHLLVRDPKKLKFNPENYSNITLITGELEHVEDQVKTLQEADYVIHIATAWGDSDASTHLNKNKTFDMLNNCNPKRLKKILYFSTASILGKDNTPQKEAEEFGTGYIRSKYRTYIALKESPWADKLYTFFPTLVFGGDKYHPYSHISEGILPNVHWLTKIRHIYMNSTFHFLHAHDTASVVAHVLTHALPERDFVLGNDKMTGRAVISTLCATFKIPPSWQVKVTPWLLLTIVKLFKIKVAPWDKFCIEHPFFEYNVVNPTTYGLTTRFPTLTSVLENIKSNQV